MEQLGPDTIQHIAGLVGVDLAAREKPPAPTAVRLWRLGWLGDCNN